MKAVIDRIEGKIAVLLIEEQGQGDLKLDIPINLLPQDSKESDILEICITKDEKATKDAKARVTNLIEKLKSKNR